MFPQFAEVAEVDEVVLLVVVVDGAVVVAVVFGAVVVVVGADAAGGVVVGAVVAVGVVVVLGEVDDCDVDGSEVVVDGAVVDGFVDPVVEGGATIRWAAKPDTCAGEPGVHDACCCQEVTFSWMYADPVQYVSHTVAL
ncbi:hypothetical protein [Jongsikchunia kroppenstedtii]|uniref:hypothetical protein n=1 Tax=Jongsikchunia kroppenstedtii TaxID=1121721 RepID=UPI00036BF325|nr:hypothetical protein [Jongsikchunia kroppenstedtii]